MAQRHVSMDLRKLADFLKTYKGSLAAGAILVPAAAIDGELAPEFRVEIQLPFGLSTPPIACQTIQRLPDGSVAGQIPQLPAKAKSAFEAVMDGIAQVRAHLLETGELVEPGAVPVPAPELVSVSEPAKVASPEPKVPIPAPKLQEPEPELAFPAERPPPPPQAELVPEAQPAPAPVAEVELSHPAGLLLPQAFDQVTPQEEGELGGRLLRQQVMDLGFTGATGILHIQQADGTQRFGFWLRGGPVGWRREPLEPKETLGGLLVRSKHITAEQLQQALSRQGRTQERLGQILVEEGTLPAEQLGPVLSKQVEFVLQLALRAREGSWRFLPMELDQSFPLQPINVLEVLYGAMASHGRTLSPDRIFGVIRPQLNKRIKLLPSAEGLIDRARWSPDERLLVDALQASSSLVRNVFNQVDLPRGEVAVILWALSELGVLNFGSSAEGVDKKRYLKQITGPIQDRLAKVKDANPFDTLDLSWICAQEQVERAYKTWQARFSVERFEVLNQELRAALEEIEGAHQAAYQAIATQAQRRALREGLVGEQAVQDAARLLNEKAQSMGDAQKASQARAKAADLVS